MQLGASVCHSYFEASQDASRHSERSIDSKISSNHEVMGFMKCQIDRQRHSPEPPLAAQSGTARCPTNEKDECCLLVLHVYKRHSSSVIMTNRIIPPKKVEGPSMIESQSESEAKNHLLVIRKHSRYIAIFRTWYELPIYKHDSSRRDETRRDETETNKQNERLIM